MPASPSAVSQAPNPFPTAAERAEAERDSGVHIRYSRSAVSPIGWMVATFAAIGAGAWSIGWSEFTRDATDPVMSSEWWANVTGVLLPGEDLRIASYSAFRMWVCLAILVGAMLLLAGWIGRLGRNLRAEHTPFGAFLPLVALPAWWILPITLGTTDNSNRTRADMLLRFLVAFAILFAQFLLVRWPFLNRIWRAGHLRYDPASIILWLPMMIPWSMIMLSSAFTLLRAGDDGITGDSAWRPTSAMYDWARGVTRATELGILVLLVVVTIAQQVGIQRDRADERARRTSVEATRTSI